MDIAEVSMAMSTSQIATAFTTGLAKKVMDSQEEMAQSMIEQMMPPAPSVMMGNYIDTYA